MATVAGGRTGIACGDDGCAPADHVVGVVEPSCDLLEHTVGEQVDEPDGEVGAPRRLRRCRSGRQLHRPCQRQGGDDGVERDRRLGGHPLRAGVDEKAGGGTGPLVRRAEGGGVPLGPEGGRAGVGDGEAAPEVGVGQGVEGAAGSRRLLDEAGDDRLGGGVVVLDDGPAGAGDGGEGTVGAGRSRERRGRQHGEGPTHRFGVGAGGGEDGDERGLVEPVSLGELLVPAGADVDTDGDERGRAPVEEAGDGVQLSLGREPGHGVDGGGELGGVAGPAGEDQEVPVQADHRLGPLPRREVADGLPEDGEGGVEVAAHGGDGTVDAGDQQLEAQLVLALGEPRARAARPTRWARSPRASEASVATARATASPSPSPAFVEGVGEPVEPVRRGRGRRPGVGDGALEQLRREGDLGPGRPVGRGGVEGSRPGARDRDGEAADGGADQIDGGSSQRLVVGEAASDGAGGDGVAPGRDGVDDPPTDGGDRPWLAPRSSR